MTATTSAPRTGGRLRGVLVGIAALLVVVVVAVAVVALTRPRDRAADFLSPTSGSPAGARALVEVLRDQGVDVEPATTLREVRAVGSDPAATTILLYDDAVVLGSAQRRELLTLTDRLVILDALDAELADLAPGVAFAGEGFGGTFTVDCDLPAAVRARAVAGSPYRYDVADAEADVTTCFTDPDDADLVALVHTRTRGVDVTVVGLAPSFTNADILDAGNAALALNLLGERETLIWYRPDLSDVESGEIPTVTALTPPWLTPLVVLLALVALAAAVWRGRRIGPLVAEKLPVVVRARETMEGRARLYERAGDRGHALDALRIGAITRLASSCGLPRRANVDEVVEAVAAITGHPRAHVAALLLETVPTNDRGLVDLSDELQRLETEVARATRGR
jgi:hypothetical protein